MLSLIKNNNLCNILVIVTRYFGGILLGTGGLVRAYTDVTKQVIEDSEIIIKSSKTEINIKIDYQNFEKLKYFCKTNNILITNIEYLDIVVCNILVDENLKEQLVKNIEEKVINLIEFNVLLNKFIW